MQNNGTGTVYRLRHISFWFSLEPCFFEWVQHFRILYLMECFVAQLSLTSHCLLDSRVNLRIAGLMSLTFISIQPLPVPFRTTRSYIYCDFHRHQRVLVADVPRLHVRFDLAHRSVS